MTLILQEHNWASKRLGCKCYLKLFLELSRDNHVKNYAKSLVQSSLELLWLLWLLWFKTHNMNLAFPLGLAPRLLEGRILGKGYGIKCGVIVPD
jgi:hypothetical protein